ncbi:hypothetical protein ABC383_14655 [Noviherbaspirillum sp. 1P10PC]|uniref:hypothetical protein n=1 Tax=Noviherbaspirillum sp. 1P10PC TaxID=3132292 RepID=UPI0039A1DCBB
MAVVSISEASRLVGKTRQTLYNDRDSGKLSWTTLETGKPGIDTAELQRVYGQLKLNPVGQAVRNVNFDTQDGGADSTVDPTVHAVLETELKGAQQRIELLERMLSLEAAARRQQLESQRAELMAKDQIIGVLQNQMKLLEYIAPVKPASHDQARTVDMQTGQTADTQAPASARQASNGRGWLSRLWRRAA